MNFSDFLSFEKLISTSVIKFLYWIGIVGICLTGLTGMLFSFSYYGGGVLQFLLSLIGTAAALLFWRVICEIYIVVFGIYDRLGAIRDKIGTTPRAL